MLQQRAEGYNGAKVGFSHAIIMEVYLAIDWKTSELAALGSLEKASLCLCNNRHRDILILFALP